MSQDSEYLAFALSMAPTAGDALLASHVTAFGARN